MSLLTDTNFRFVCLFYFNDCWGFPPHHSDFPATAYSWQLRKLLSFHRLWNLASGKCKYLVLLNINSCAAHPWGVVLFPHLCYSFFFFFCSMIPLKESHIGALKCSHEACPSRRQHLRYGGHSLSHGLRPGGLLRCYVLHCRRQWPDITTSKSFQAAGQFWSVSHGVPRSQGCWVEVSLAHLCTVSLCHTVLIFYTKSGSNTLVVWRALSKTWNVLFRIVHSL